MKVEDYMFVDESDEKNMQEKICLNFYSLTKKEQVKLLENLYRKTLIFKHGYVYDKYQELRKSREE